MRVFCWAQGRSAYLELANIAQNARRGQSISDLAVALEAAPSD
ncbi:hypothetical protein ABIB85_008353 [Bradyrhizobium sp. JR1.5]